jgi:hypothetical protein
MKKLITLFICAVVVSSSALASFPVESIEKADKATVETPVVEADNDEIVTPISKEEAKASKKAAKAEFKKMKKAAKQSGSSAPDMEFWITLALWFFLGFFAAHRWYRGKPAGWNILYIITFGGLGIWALVDLVFILTGKF